VPRIPEEIVEAFRSVAPALEEFARRHNLLIERYRRGKAAWELRFARGLGGEATVAITYREATGHVLDVTALWWLDDFDSRTRRIRTEKVAAYDRREPAATLGRHLEEALRRIDRWTPADLGAAFGPFVQWTKLYTAETFAAERARLPVR